MNFKKWVKSIQTAGYNGARTVYICILTKTYILLVKVTSAVSLSSIWFQFKLTLASSKSIFSIISKFVGKSTWQTTAFWFLSTYSILFYVPYAYTNMYAIITLYIYYPIFEVHFFVFKEFFQDFFSFSIQEWFMIKSRLWWRTVNPSIEGLSI